MTSKPPLIGRGATGSVYWLTKFIVVKQARCGEDEEIDHANEQAVFRFLEAYPPIPYLVRCIYQTPKNTFLEFAPNGSLAMELNKYQRRNEAQVLAVTRNFDTGNIHRWMWQLCCAAAYFEKAGLTHGDIRPGNLLFSSEWDLRLADLDRSVKIGEDAVVLTEPFGRLLNKEEGEHAGTYGKAGARTETFAIGSVYYTLLRGYEPYEVEYWGDNHGVIMSDKLQCKEFPQLTNSPEDTVIRKCWNEEYASVKELLAEFKDAGGDDGTKNKQKLGWIEDCERIVESGILVTLGSHS